MTVDLNPTTAPVPNPAGDPVLVVDSLSTTFHTIRGPVRAVDDVSLTLSRGETLGIVGESGSGKSVLGRTIMGLITSSAAATVEGRSVVSGTDIQAVGTKERRAVMGRKISMVFQDPMTSLNPVKKIGAHLSETLRIGLGVPRAQVRERSIDLLQQVGIPEPARRLEQYPHELSGGMRQRVVIAMALACSPEVLIADEPTTALDVTVQKQILDLIERLAADLGMATILISHDLGAVADRSDRVMVMYAARIAERSAADVVFGDPRHPYTEALIESIPSLANNPHAHLRTIAGAPPNLLRPPEGCRFAPRCQYAQDVCRTEVPLLAGPIDHPAACHFPLHTAGVRRTEGVRDGGNR